MSRTTQARTERSTIGLRDTLFDELDKLRAGKTTAQQTNACAKLAVQIINSAKLEIDYQRLSEELPTLTPKTAIALGRK